MAVSISIVDRFKYGNAMTVVADVTFDSSYPTDGESISASSFGLKGIQHIPDFVATSSGGGYVGRWNQSKTAAKLVLYSYDTTVGGASDVAALTYASPGALTSAQISGGESPTEAEFNALQTDVAAISTALIALGVDVTAIRTGLVALTGTKTGVLGQVPDTTNLSSPSVTARVMVIGY